MGFDLIVVGHITYDLIRTPHKKPYKALGGVATYTSLAAANLGARVGIVSKVGADFKQNHLSHFKKASIELTGLGIAKTGTTIFENIYDEQGYRKQRLLNCCEEIRVSDIPNEYFDSKFFHFGPVFDEVPYEMIKFIHDKKILTSLDVQGYCRRRERDLSIKLADFEGARDVLPYVDILKCDEKEAKIITNEDNMHKAALLLRTLGSKIVLITRGSEGSILCHKEKIEMIPMIPAMKVVDLTGAGDTYVAGFIVEYLNTKNPEWAANFASGTASLKVEGRLTSTIRSKENVLRRLEEFENRRIGEK